MLHDLITESVINMELNSNDNWIACLEVILWDGAPCSWIKASDLWEEYTLSTFKLKVWAK
jgi:hypothetical protein